MNEPNVPPTLTRTQQDILRLSSVGLSALEVALSLGIPREAVRSELTLILQRLGATSKLEACILWLRQEGNHAPH